MDKRAAADFLDGILREQRIEKYSYFLNQSEKQELNLESGEFKLMRTVFNNTTSVKVFYGTKMGSAGGNDMTEEGLRKLADEARAAAESASEENWWTKPGLPRNPHPRIPAMTSPRTRERNSSAGASMNRI